MKIGRWLPPLFKAFGLFLFVGTSSPQSAPSPFDRSRTIDVDHYSISVSFNRSNKSINGSTAVTFRPLSDGFTSLTLDAEGLSFTSATLIPDGRDLPIFYGKGTVTAKLPKAYGKGATVTVRFDYTAKPKKGIYFVNESKANGRIKHSAQIWTQGETEEARHWFPGFDFPSDKATSEQFITTDSEDQVIANGQLKEVRANADGTKTHHFVMDLPHSTYLVSFVVGQFVRKEDSYGRVPLGFYLYPSQPDVAASLFAKTKLMMGAFEDLTGIQYPFNKYDQTIVADFNFGGMENITATTLSDRDIALANNPLGQDLVEDLISHELAHSWFGNLVTCRNWAELWLNEGFATFMEAAWREKAYGRENYVAKLRSDMAEYFFTEVRRSAKHGLYNLLARPDDSIFDSTTYKKGGAVVHMLRDTVGDAVFWKAINRYLTTHRLGVVSTEDLKRIFEQESGKDLNWFFDQWVYGIGYPQLKVASSFDTRTGKLSMTVAQTQTPQRLVPGAYRLPLEFDVETTKGTQRVTMDITKRIQTASFALDGRPTAVDPDPDFRIPVKTVEVAKTSIR